MSTRRFLMKSFNANLLNYSSAEEELMRAKLKAIRAAIPPQHRSDKGRSVETAVYRFFRDLLPSEYGLTTGFVAYHDSSCIVPSVHIRDGIEHTTYNYHADLDKILVSSQLDLIIYDALRYGPIAHLEACDVLPFEAVMGYVEVKSWIDNETDDNGYTPLQNILIQSQRLRDIKARLYWVSEPGTYTQSALFPYPLEESISMRSYVFVLDTVDSLKDFDRVKVHLEDERSKDIHGFITSMYIQDVGCFRSHHAETAADPLIGTYEGTPENPLAAFKTALLSSLARFPRTNASWTPALDRYYENTTVRAAQADLTRPSGGIPQVDIWIDSFSNRP
jgi:hypothetical protein